VPSKLLFLRWLKLPIKGGRYVARSQSEVEGQIPTIGLITHRVRRL